MELDLRSIVNVSLSDGQSSAERSLLLDFPPKCCAAQPRRTRCLFSRLKKINFIDHYTYLIHNSSTLAFSLLPCQTLQVLSYNRFILGFTEVNMHVIQILPIDWS